MNDAAAIAHALDAEVSALLATLPALPTDRLAGVGATATTLAESLTGEACALAATLAVLAGLYAEGRAVPEGWAYMASAAHTLSRAVAEPDSGHAAALAAARHELSTLLPSSGGPPPSLVQPDVPASALARK